MTFGSWRAIRIAWSAVSVSSPSGGVVWPPLVSGFVEPGAELPVAIRVSPCESSASVSAAAGDGQDTAASTRARPAAPARARSPRRVS